MPKTPNHTCHESMDAVVGAPEMKVEPIAFKIEIKPADAGVKEKAMVSNESDTVSKSKDPMDGIDYRKEGSAIQRFGVVSLVVRSVVHLSNTTSRHGDSWTCYDYAEVAKRCGELVPGKSYQFFFATKDWDLVGWKEAPIPDELQVFSYDHGAPPAEEPAPEQPADKEQEAVGVPEYGFNSVGVFLRWEEHMFFFQNERGDEDHWFLSGTCRDEAISRCGDMVPGKRYRWLWDDFTAHGGGRIVGWREEPLKEEPKPAPPAPAAPPADTALSAMRFMAKRLGVRLPDDVAGVGHATNVIEDALGAKMQQAMADTGFGVIHDILRALGINLEDNKGEPLGSYRQRVQAAIRGRIALAEMEGHDAGVNEVLKSLEDQIEYGEGQRKMLAEQLERVNVHRLTLQQVHADARKMRRGGAS